MRLINMSFSRQEWDTCIRVLQVLSRDPDQSPDNETLKGLVTKLYRRAKKDNKQRQIDETASEIINTTRSLSLQKIQKISKGQVVIRQYDRSIRSQSLLFRNYGQPYAEAGASVPEMAELKYPQKCYSCKTPYKQVHFFYHLLCPDCADFNYRKRLQQCDLKGRVALITGGRVKIGYLTALRMLRDGAKVWVTTRFPNDCILRFSKEADYDQWQDRLKVVALDLRHLGQVNKLIQYLEQEEKHLDIIINNAAQTIKRPPEFYHHLLEGEQNTVMLPENVRKCIAEGFTFQWQEDHNVQKLLPVEASLFFPENSFDKDRQQIDLRPENSWSTLLQEVTPVEMLETQLVNVTAPFMLNSGLKPLLLRSPFQRKFIINVSAMEGQFGRSSKTPYHPHTNMAKAALNMMTRTSAQDYAADDIFMNSVDTGWITQEQPHPKKQRLYEEEGFVPPLDEIDGMARIYDPVVTGITSEEVPLFGHFLKDYQPYPW